MILTLARHEIRRLFRSPLLWLLLAAYAFLLAYLFLGFIETFNLSVSTANAGAQNPAGVTQSIATPVFLWGSLLGYLLLPPFAGRLIAEERQKQTWSMLASAPISGWQIALGKYLGFLGPIALLSLFPLAMALSLLAGGPIDLGRVLSGWLGSILSLAAFGAAIFYFSCLVREPVTAILLAYGLLILLVIIHVTAGSGTSNTNGLYELSPLKHLTPLINGRINGQDLAYFAGFLGLFLWLSGRRLSHPTARHTR